MKAIDTSRFIAKDFLYAPLANWAFNLPFVKAPRSSRKNFHLYLVMELVKNWPTFSKDYESLPPKEQKDFLTSVKTVINTLEDADRGHGGRGPPLDLHLTVGWARVMAEKRYFDGDDSVQGALVFWQKLGEIVEEVVSRLKGYEDAAIEEAEREEAQTPEKRPELISPPSSAEHAAQSKAASIPTAAVIARCQETTSSNTRTAHSSAAPTTSSAQRLAPFTSALAQLSSTPRNYSFSSPGGPSLLLPHGRLLAAPRQATSVEIPQASARPTVSFAPTVSTPGPKSKLTAPKKTTTKRKTTADIYDMPTSPILGDIEDNSSGFSVSVSKRRRMSPTTITAPSSPIL